MWSPLAFLAAVDPCATWLGQWMLGFGRNVCVDALSSPKCALVANLYARCERFAAWQQLLQQQLSATDATAAGSAGAAAAAGSAGPSSRALAAAAATSQQALRSALSLLSAANVEQLCAVQDLSMLCTITKYARARNL